MTAVVLEATPAALVAAALGVQVKVVVVLVGLRAFMLGLLVVSVIVTTVSAVFMVMLAFSVMVGLKPLPRYLPPSPSDTVPRLTGV